MHMKIRSAGSHRRDSAQFRDWLPILQDGNRPAGEIGNCDLRSINPEVSVDGREKITDHHAAISDLLAVAIGATDDLAGRNASSGEQ